VLQGAICAGPAGATVVVGRGIAGVRLGDTTRQTRHALGRPRCVSCSGGKHVWAFRKPLFGNVGFSTGGRVYGISTKSPSQRTRSGIHPASSKRDAAGRPTRAGSSAARVKRAYSRASCGVGPQLGSSFQCTIRSRLRGRVVVTRFGVDLPGYGVTEIDVEFG
jgi:hypothetical protein